MEMEIFTLPSMIEGENWRSRLRTQRFVLEPQLTVSGPYIFRWAGFPARLAFSIPIVRAKGHGPMFSYSAQDGPTFA